MIRAKVLKPLIYKGRAYKVGDIFDCDEKTLLSFEKRGLAERLLDPSGGDDELGEIVPVLGLPTLEEEQKAKGKKK